MTTRTVYVSVTQLQRVKSCTTKESLKNLSELMAVAIEWYKKNKTKAQPFVYASLRRVGRKVEVSDDNWKYIRELSSSFGLAETKTLTIILWLYLIDASVTEPELTVCVNKTLVLSLDDEIFSMIDKNENRSRVILHALKLYKSEGYHTRAVANSKKKGVRKNLVCVYIKDDVRDLLNEFTKESGSSPQHIIADAICEMYKMGVTDEQPQW